MYSKHEEKFKTKMTILRIQCGFAISKLKACLKIPTLLFVPVIILFLVQFQRLIIPGFGLKSSPKFTLSSITVNELSFPDYSFLPVSKLRPFGQFIANSKSEEPILTVITITRNPNIKNFVRTAEFVLLQSLNNIRWVVIVDSAPSQKLNRKFLELRENDNRLHFIKNFGKSSKATGRELGRLFVRQHRTKYFTFLGDEDQLELNTYEKLVWSLESNEKIAMMSGLDITLGYNNYTSTSGFHDGSENFDTKNMGFSMVMRASSVLQTPCKFDSINSSEMMHWYFLLCLSSHGLWGITLPEFTNWIRRKDISQSTDVIYHSTKQLNRYNWLRNSFPKVIIEETKPTEALPLHIPFRNHLLRDRGFLVITSTLTEDSSHEPLFSLVRDISRRLIPVTILCTLQEKNIHEMPIIKFQQLTHDIFVLPSFLRLIDIPRFVRYIVESRAIANIAIIHSVLGYGLLPIIHQQFPTIPKVDFILHTDTERVNEPFIHLSREYSKYIDVTFAGSAKIRRYLIGKGHPKHKVVNTDLILPLQVTKPLSKKDKILERAKLGISEHSIVALMYQRYSSSSSGAFFMKILNALHSETSLAHNSGNPRLVMVLVLQEKINDINLSILQGEHTGVQLLLRRRVQPEQLIKYLGMCDIVCLPDFQDIHKNIVLAAAGMGVVPIRFVARGHAKRIPYLNDAGFTRKIGINGTMNADLFVRELKTVAFDTDALQINTRRVRELFSEQVDPEKAARRTVQKILGTKKFSKERPTVVDSFDINDVQVNQLFSSQGHVSDLRVSYKSIKSYLE